MTDKLDIAVDGAVAIVALADPSTLNAIGPSLCTSLTRAFETLAAEGKVRAAILTAFAIKFARWLERALRGGRRCSGSDLGSW